MSYKFFFVGVLLFASSISISGCDQIKSKLNGLVSDPSQVDMADKLNRLVKDGEYNKAITQGEAYLDKNQDSDGFVSEAVINAYMATGNTQGVVIHLQKYRSSGVASKDTVINSSSPNGAISNQQINQSSHTSVTTDGASVTHTKQGTVVRAGDAVVVMPK